MSDVSPELSLDKAQSSLVLNRNVVLARQSLQQTSSMINTRSNQTYNNLSSPLKASPGIMSPGIVRFNSNRKG